MDPAAAPSYQGCRFPAEILSHCVWLYFRFCLSLRDVQEMMLERGVEVSHKRNRLWTLRSSVPNMPVACGGVAGATAIWHRNEVFNKINGELVYLWRAVDWDGSTLDVLARKRRMRRFKSTRRAQRFFTVHGAEAGHFCPCRHRLRAKHYRKIMHGHFAAWTVITGAGTEDRISAS